jgi:hypothetical protein
MRSNLIQADPSRKKVLLCQTVIFCPFMEAISSLPCLQQFSACYNVFLRASHEALQSKTFYCFSCRTVKCILDLMALIKMVENRIYSSWVLVFLSSPSTWFPVNLQIHLSNSNTEAKEKKKIKEEHEGKKEGECWKLIKRVLILFLCLAVR